MFRAAPLLLTLLSLTAFTQRPLEPYQVKADRLGETFEQWTANNPHSVDCQNNTFDKRPGSVIDPDVQSCVPGDMETLQNLTFAAVPLLSEKAWFYKGILFKIEMEVRSRSWSPKLLEALVGKYGKARIKEANLESGFGAKVATRTYTWTNGISTITFNEYVPSVVITLNGSNKELGDRIKRTEVAKSRSDM